jgi:hypothetical protein
MIEGHPARGLDAGSRDLSWIPVFPALLRVSAVFTPPQTV